MLPGSHSGSNKDRGMKQMAQRGLIKDGGPKAYPLANNDPNSKPIEDWEIDVDLGGGTLDRQTKLKDVRPTTARDNTDGEKGIFTQALINSNMQDGVSPEGGNPTHHTEALSAMNRRYDKYSNTGDFEMMTNSDSNNLQPMRAAEYGRNKESENDYYSGLEDSPESSRRILSPRGDTRTQDKRDRADFLGIERPITGSGYRYNPSESPIGEQASSSEFKIGRKVGGISTASITNSGDIADRLQKAGTLDPEYRKKLEDYKKNN